MWCNSSLKIGKVFTYVHFNPLHHNSETEIKLSHLAEGLLSCFSWLQWLMCPCVMGGNGPQIHRLQPSRASSALVGLPLHPIQRVKANQGASSCASGLLVHFWGLFYMRKAGAQGHCSLLPKHSPSLLAREEVLSEWQLESPWGTHWN